MRLRFLAILLPLFGSQPAATASPPHATTCATLTTAWQVRRLRCAVPPASSAAPLRFVARFDGGHDDTELSLAPTLDGRPLTCGAGSRIELVGGDGRVELDCRFSPPAGAASLEVVLKVHHADFVDAALEAPHARP